jgi:hypothetical protein
MNSVGHGSQDLSAAKCLGTTVEITRMIPCANKLMIWYTFTAIVLITYVAFESFDSLVHGFLWQFGI